MPATSSELAGLSGKTPNNHLAKPDHGGSPDSEWVSREIQAMASAWARGQCTSAEEILARYPDSSDEAAIRLIYEEVCLRRESGQEVATTEVVNRFPRWRDQLEVLLGCDRMVRPLARIAVLPEPGEELGPFRLLAELGRGASGKTYLAAEPGLADRLIVLKVIPDDQDEHLSLARLQHTHIVPLFSEQTFPERGLRALCMPFLGGTSLARILAAVSGIPPAQRRGRDVLDSIDSAHVGRPSLPFTDGPYRRFLEQASYIQAVCWIGACLAEALESTHAHGLVHMDVKPSNVLIAADGLPMLLDFHLARRPIKAGERVIDRLGGTPGWMAPEHEAALEAVAHGQEAAQQIDCRADIHALGLLLCEALGGPGLIGREPGGQACRRRNPEVSVALADLIDKCLAASPPARYGAAALADDLRRHINDLPLQGAPNRSLVETWRKWRRRRPAALSRGSALLTALGALVIVVALLQVVYQQRVHEIESDLEYGKTLRASGRFPEAIRTLGRGLERTLGVPRVQPLAAALSEQLKRAQRGQKASALHDLAETIRFRYGIDLPDGAEARTLMRNIRAIWAERDELLNPEAACLGADTEQNIRADLLDLAITCAESQVWFAPPAEAEATRTDALRMLDEAKASCGPSPRLDRLRRSIAGIQGRDDSIADHGSATMSTRDHYDLGRAYLHARRFQDAAREFDRVLARRPQDFWSNFYEGLCAYRLGRFHDAVSAFRTCVALAPSSAECYYNRARAAEALGQNDDAERDYSRALELDSGLTAAWLNRGILAYKTGGNDHAIADFHRALRTATDEQTQGRIEYNLALAYSARGDHARGLASSEAALAHGHDAARRLCDQLQQRQP
jgi:serine/threonine protein kinase/Flp pilus assembly protein TadD